LSAEGLQYGFKKCAGFLKLKEIQDLGLTVAVTSKWMFVAPLKGPYISIEDDTNVYLDGFAFTGLLQL